MFLGNIASNWEIQFRALIQKPSSNNLHYAAQATPLPIQSPNWNIFDLHPDYHFGFDIGARAFLRDCNSHISANWIHFKSNTCAAHDVPVDTDMIGPFFEIGPDALPYKKASGSVKFRFNAAHLTYGQFICWSECFQTNVFVGVNFADIKQCLSSTYQGTDTQGSNPAIMRTISTPSSFIGAGPELGCEFAYALCHGLNLLGRFAGSILMGPTKNCTLYSSESPALIVAGFPTPNNQTTCVENRSQVVPAFEERLGVAYLFPFCECYQIKLEAGYEARVYINALQSVDMGSEVVTPPFPAVDAIGVFARTFHRTLSNFALAGPYVAFEIAF